MRLVNDSVCALVVGCVKGGHMVLHQYLRLVLLEEFPLVGFSA